MITIFLLGMGVVAWSLMAIIGGLFTIGNILGGLFSIVLVAASIALMVYAVMIWCKEK